MSKDAFRKELKYLINNNEKIILEERLKTLLNYDKHSIDGNYKIISLYFDDYKKTSYNQVIDGISERWKWRIRYYNFDDSYVCLEKKYKVNGLTAKKKIKLSKEKTLDIINNKNIKIDSSNDKLLNEFYLNILTKLLKPRAIVIYDRIPYTYSAGNVRITIDYNLCTSNDFKNLFNEKLNIIPVMDKDHCVLEVKYNDFIPDYIRHKLQLNELTKTSYSKFIKSIYILKKGGM